MTNEIIEAAAKVDRLLEPKSCDTAFRANVKMAREELAALAAMPVPSPWRDIETAPKDRLIEVYAPAFEDALGPMISLCQWHPDAGFCVCQLRNPTHWREHIIPEQPS